METNQAEQNAPLPQWAVIELMGHVRYGGMVSKDNQFASAMLRVEVPQADGTFVTQFINPASLYRITLCSEEIGRAAARHGVSAPISQWELKQLLAPPAPEPEDETPAYVGHPDDEDRDDGNELF